MAVLPRTLAQMVNRPTAWEVEVSLPTGTSVVAYTERKTKQVLLQLARHHADLILHHIPDDAKLVWDNRLSRWQLGPGVHVGFTGRTEREVATALMREGV